MQTNIIQKPTVREALLYEKLRGGRVRCLLCERRCSMEPGASGFCGIRVNIEGRLYTLVYGNLSAVESRPIEIKPFYHYWPGSYATTFSTWSCNFACPWCQNYHLSRRKPDPLVDKYMPPEQLIEYSKYWGDEGLCVSFQEPTLLLEYSIDVFKLGVSRGLYCCFVSNGYMTLEALRLLRESGMDGLKVDMKGDEEVYKRYCGGVDVDVVWRNIEKAREMGYHVEVVNLVVTGVNDREEQIEWVVERHLKHAGAEAPIHFTRYFPAYKFSNPPTPIKTLESAVKLARKMGVMYPYIGNVPGHWGEHTYCPECGEAVIKRMGVRPVRCKLDKEGKCLNCGFKLHIRGRILCRRRS